MALNAALTVLLVSGLSQVQMVHAKEKACEYRADAESVKASWTAFKTTKKVPVHGEFLNATVKVPNAAGASLERVLKGASVKIEKKSVETKDPARNTTLAESFFNKLSGEIEAKVLSYKRAEPKEPAEKTKENAASASEEKGVLTLEVSLNKVKKRVALDSVWKEDGSFEATGALKLLDHKADAALKSLNEACGALHKGEDGVSKTWDEVDLKVVAKIERKCP